MDAVLFAASLGLISGLSPGPLMTVVLAASLERGFGAGLRTALAPLLTDVPVVLLSLLVLRQVPEWFLAAVTLVGGLFVGWVGVSTLRSARRGPPEPGPTVSRSRDVWRGALVNLLSPHPWLFWFTVGTPFMIRGWAEAPWTAVAFFVVFLSLLVGCKIGIAWGAAHGRRFLDARWYQIVMGLCGALLVIFGALLVWRAYSTMALTATT